MTQLVCDLMTRDVETVTPEMPALWAAKRMAHRRIRHLVVTDISGWVIGRVIGIVSDRDVLKHLSPWLSKFNGQDNCRLTNPRCYVRDIMQSPPVVTTPDATLSVAAGILGEKKIGCLPVVDGKMRPVGILSVVDLLLHIAADSAPEENSAEKFEFYRPPAILEENGNLVLPMDGLDIAEGNDKQIFARLGYQSPSGRVAIELFTDEQPAGALPVHVSDDQMVIEAKEFVEHNNIEYSGSYKVMDDDKSGYIVLSPPHLV